MPDDLRASLPYIHQLIEGFNIQTIKTPGFEADDAIGTLAKVAELQGFTTYMMTPDKDYGQLVDENTFIYKPARFGNAPEIQGKEEICKKWDIKSVDQLIDILGLMGDSADNIPGIPGVGEKTAIQLIKDYGTIEKMYEDTSKLKGKLKEKVDNNKEMALQSKRLATIILDVPVEFNESELVLKEINKEALRILFAELEFRGIAQKILGEDIGRAPNTSPKTVSVSKEVAKPIVNDLFSSAEELATVYPEVGEETEAPIFKTIKDFPVDYILCNTPESISNLISVLNSNNQFLYLLI